MQKLNTLKKLGLTEYEAKTYLALANLGVAKTSKIALKANIPRNKAYEAIEKLIAKDLIEILPLTPKSYKIADPLVLKTKVEELNSNVDTLIQELNTPPPNEFQEVFLVLKGQKSIMNKMFMQTQKTTQEIISCNKMTLARFQNIDSITKAVKRGVNVKMIIDPENKNKEVIKQWIKTGAHIRGFNKKLFGTTIPRISAYDKKIARLTIGSPEIQDKREYISFWTESHSFTSVIRNHLLTLWENSIEIT